MLQRVLNRARRRALVNQALRSCARGLIAGLAIALGTLIIDRVAGLALPVQAYALPPLAGLLAGLVVALAQRPGRFDAAVQLDRRLGLKDRVGTAEAIRLGLIPQNASREFAELAQRDAQALADRIDVQRAIPIRMDRAWALAASGALLLALGIAFVPAMNWSHAAEQAGPAALAPSPAELIQTRTAIAQSIQQASQSLGDSPSDEQARQQLADLDRLAEQLAKAPDSEPQLREARDETAAQLQDVADTIDRKARSDMATVDQVAQKFSGLPPTDSPMTADQFAESLRRGDFGKAADTLEKVLADPNALTDQQRRQLADHLRDLREKLDHPPTSPASDTSATPESSSAPDSAAQEADKPQEQLRQALRDQGLDDRTIDDFLKNSSPTEPSAGEQEQALREKGVDEDVAQRLAQELQRTREQQEIKRQAQEESQKLSDALEQTARELTQPPDQSPPQTAPPPPESSAPTEKDQQQPQEKQQDRTTDPGDQKGAKPDKAPNARPDQPSGAQPGQKTESQPGPKPGTQPSAKHDQKPDQSPDAPGTPGQQPGQKPEPQPGQQPGEQPNPKPEQNPGSSGTQPGQTPDPKSGQQPGAQPVAKPNAKPGPAPAAQPGQKPQPQPGRQPGAKPSEEPGAVPSAKEISTPSKSPDGNPGTQPGPSVGSRPDEQPSSGPDEKKTDQGRPTGAQPAGEKPSGEPQSENGAGGPDDASKQSSPAPAPGPGRSITKALRELAERRESAQRRQADSESIRKAARELAQKLTPQERRELERWAKSAAAEMRDSGGHGPDVPGTRPGADSHADPSEPLAHTSTHDIDAGGKEIGDKVIAQWLGHESESTATGEGGRTESSSDQIRSAQQQAQRAVNESAVPPRYHEYIRRFFGRLDETARRAAPGSPAAPAEAPLPAPATPPPAPPPPPATPPVTNQSP